MVQSLKFKVQGTKPVTYRSPTLGEKLCKDKKNPHTFLDVTDFITSFAVIFFLWGLEEVSLKELKELMGRICVTVQRKNFMIKNAETQSRRGF